MKPLALWQRRSAALTLIIVVKDLIEWDKLCGIMGLLQVGAVNFTFLSYKWDGF